MFRTALLRHLCPKPVLRPKAALRPKPALHPKPVLQPLVARELNTSTKPIFARAVLTVSRKYIIGTLGAAGAATCLYLYCQTAQAKEETARSNPRFVLYQYSNCPFCSKVRAYLHASGQEFDVVEVNPITKAETKAITDYKKVPMLVADGIVLKDSSVIISILHTHFTTGKPISEVVELYPVVQVSEDNKVPVVKFTQSEENMKQHLLSIYNNIIYYWRKDKQKEECPNKYVIMGYNPDKNKEMHDEVKWRKWIDDHFVHLISPNVYRTWTEALAAFDYFTTNGKFTEFQKLYTRYIGAAAMYMIGKKLRDRHNLNEDVRSDLYSGVNKWLRGMKGQDFMGGSEPNLADIDMWGMCSAFHGLQCWTDVCKVTKIEPWYSRMQDYLEEKSKREITCANPT